jgi:hypothetical protein
LWALTAINIATGAHRILLPGQKLIAINASFSPCFIKFYGRHKKKTRRTRNRRDKDKDVERNRVEKALKFGLEETLRPMQSPSLNPRRERKMKSDLGGAPTMAIRQRQEDKGERAGNQQ